MVPVRKREKWFLSLGVIAVEWWDIPKGESISSDGKGKMLSQEGHLQNRVVSFDAVGIEQEGLNQTSWKQPLGDPDLKKVPESVSLGPEGTTAIPGLGKRPMGLKRRNWNFLALKGAKEGYGPPDSPDVDLIYPAFHKPSSQDDRNDPYQRSEVASSSGDSPTATKLTLNHLEKVEASISSQKVVDWMIDPVGTESANWADHRPPPSKFSTPESGQCVQS